MLLLLVLVSRYQQKYVLAEVLVYSPVRRRFYPPVEASGLRLVGGQRVSRVLPAAS